jgi:hypothetical protein
MAKLPLERKKELLELFGASRKCPPDEISVRRQRYWDAIHLAINDCSLASAEELDAAIRHVWFQANKMRPATV